ncbi:hypothetical protein Ahy_Scaffold2g107642 [Arachis hypogaea]|uniref:Uncharacterized protein n=1 Tax=Arachis hypogaea TaxID=3818 RepID=A0A444WQI2_ARAHY|nr:hypothetical protein Ahy_Scaffold2g107642 [Arachis hypogaea]
MEKSRGPAVLLNFGQHVTSRGSSLLRPSSAVFCVSAKQRRSSLEEGWPLGLRFLNSGMRLARNNEDYSGSLSFTTMLTDSPAHSKDSASDLDTQAKGQVRCEADSNDHDDEERL